MCIRDSFPFGAEVLRAADIRWINLGPTERGGAARFIAGEEVSASLFDACVHCGVVPAAQRGVRDRQDARHRGWCRQRREPSPTDWKTVALTHELRTQAVRLLVPPIVVADPTLLTSFRAALLLGLRQVRGGDPDHIDVVAAPDPVPESRERWVMVLHDLVPGGTGYLGRFADPQRVKELLEASLSVLTACPCISEGVAACYRCLLPHVPPTLATEARRNSAIDLLTQILARWQPRPIEMLKRIVVASHDTPIEMRLRALLLRWAKAKGAAVSTQATSHGDSAKITFPQALGDLQWALEPQVKLGSIRPDFVLTCADTEVPKIAVFCDSQRWHSSALTNRLADDADKRAGLRDQDYLVWAVTHHDLDAFAATLDGQPAVAPQWCAESLSTIFLQVARKTAAPGSVKPEVLLSDPVSMLSQFLLRPVRHTWTSPAHALALALGHGADTHQLDSEAVPVLLRSEITGTSGEVSPGQVRVASRRSSGGVVVALELRSLTDVRAWVAVDDRGETVGSSDQVDAWRDWLALSTILQFLEPGRFQAHTYRTVTAGVPGKAALLLPAWQVIADVFDGVLEDLVRALAKGETPVPEPGHEVDDGAHVIDLAWPEQRVAVVVDEDDGRDTWLAQHGWTVVPADEHAVRAALSAAGAGA